MKKYTQYHNSGICSKHDSQCYLRPSDYMCMITGGSNCSASWCVISFLNLGFTFNPALKQPKRKKTNQLQREWKDEYLIGKIKGVSPRPDYYQ